MRKTRRNFILGTGAALVGSALERAGADVVPSTSAPDIRSLLQSSGFNPDDPDSALLAVLGDTHITTDPSHPYYTLTFDDVLVAELNGLSPTITDLAIAGDLIQSHSRAIGLPRYGDTHAQQEFDAAKEQLNTRFRAGMRVWTVPGNHDTDRQETDAELWRTKLGTPPYQKSILGGVPVFFLNSGHGGMMDPAQVAWFNNEAAAIPSNQEVLIICHYPTFCLMATYAGTKRVIANAFAGHQAPVWIMSGHNHYFREDYYQDKGTRYIQGQVTSASTKIWNDGKASGYALLGLQAGRVATRIFRSTKVGGFAVLPALTNLVFSQLRWEFDRINYPGDFFHEGFYDRTGKILNYTAVDLKCHFMRTQSITWQIQLARYGGKIREFLLAGTVGAQSAPTARCLFSTTGPSGPWAQVPMPTDSASASNRTYRVPIPAAYLNASTLYVKLATDATYANADMEISGWGVAASEESLTGYERWIAKRYGTFLLTAKTHPAAIPAGSTLTNLELFAFNLAPNGPSNPGTITPPEIQGLPSLSVVYTDQTNRFQFARRKSGTNPGITCTVEESADLRNWSPVASSRFTVTSLDSTWEEIRMNEAIANGYFRVRVEKTSDPLAGFASWQNSVSVPAGTPSDRNANLIDDLLEYGFDLSPSKGNRPYDPSRAGDTHGLPTIGILGRPASRVVYARMRADASPGVRYILEQSMDQSVWSQVPPSSVSERVLESDSTWENVECLIVTSETSLFYRVRIELIQPLLQ